MPSPETAAPHRAIGLIVPSSNRVVERVAASMLAGRSRIDCCVARVPYGGIVASAAGGDAYLPAPFEAAAVLLADAGVDVICWNATRGAVLGFAVDAVLCGRIADLTGIPAVSTALATRDLLLAAPARRVGLITQGSEAESEQFVAQFRAQGVNVVDHHWLGIAENVAAAAVSGDALLQQARTLAQHSNLDDIVVWSTNLSGHAARRAMASDERFRLLDSAEIGISAALERVGC